jgi:hypothetical protein
MIGTLKKTSYKAFFKVSGENVMQEKMVHKVKSTIAIYSSPIVLCIRLLDTFRQDFSL